MKRVVEPVRKSLLDVVKKNLYAAGKVTNITRAIYIGRYSGENSSLEKRFKTEIQNLQAEYSNIRITGFLLVYPLYFVHVLETSEGLIYKHLKNMYEKNDNTCKLEESIFLPAHYHVHQRFFTEWFHVFTIPPSLFDIPVTYELSNIKTQMTNCLTKVYKLCDNIANTVHDESIPLKDVVSNMDQQISQVLPESTVIEYLLNAPTPDSLYIKNYLETHSAVPFINLYGDTIWPPPHDFMFGNDCGKDTNRKLGTTISKL